MDRLIAGFPAVADVDLMLCPDHGVAYQRDRTNRVEYDAAYFDKCAGYEDQEIARKINAGRIELVTKFAGRSCDVLDVGIGSGEFIKLRPYTWGFDVNPKAAQWLKERDLWSDQVGLFSAFTFWDVIEHIDEPVAYFQHMMDWSFLFVCLPIFGNLDQIRKSRHYRPGEHLYYFTEAGFVNWMALHRFNLRERQDFETQAGRDSVLSFAFQRAPR